VKEQLRNAKQESSATKNLPGAPKHIARLARKVGEKEVEKPN
tara:strand:- start:209 stop:334 length:126 start_codon:yes stop_codon:yes gene_type:complete